MHKTSQTKGDDKKSKILLKKKMAEDFITFLANSKSAHEKYNFVHCRDKNYSKVRTFINKCFCEVSLFLGNEVSRNASKNCLKN